MGRSKQIFRIFFANSGFLEVKYNFVTNSGLLKVKYNKGDFTWTNRRKDFLNIVEKFDCLFLPRKLADLPMIFEVMILPYLGLDHYPISLFLKRKSNLIKVPF